MIISASARASFHRCALEFTQYQVTGFSSKLNEFAENCNISYAEPQRENKPDKIKAAGHRCDVRLLWRV